MHVDSVCTTSGVQSCRNAAFPSIVGPEYLVLERQHIRRYTHPVQSGEGGNACQARSVETQRTDFCIARYQTFGGHLGRLVPSLRLVVESARTGREPISESRAAANLLTASLWYLWSLPVASGLQRITSKPPRGLGGMGLWHLHRKMPPARPVESRS